jgi:ribosomal protein L37AE/L43A
MGAWILLSKSDALRGPETYDDEESVYRYDSKVPNFKQLQQGDVVLVTDFRTRINAAWVSQVTSSAGTKRLDRCPQCKRTSQTRLGSGRWRCFACKVQYDSPVEETVSVVKYEAHLAGVSSLDPASVWIERAKSSIAPKQQNSIRRILDDGAHPAIGTLIGELELSAQLGHVASAALSTASDPESLPATLEGRKRLVVHFRIERSASAAQSAKDLHATRDPACSCEACGFSFAAVYGSHGANYIEAHHRAPLSSLDTPKVPSMSDFALVCANCHRMLHRQKNSLMTVEELRLLIASMR